MLPDFNRLRVFHLIYLKKSVVGAAGMLHITPSAVSQHLRKLETEIGTPLFTRIHKKLVPTAAADNLFHIVQPFVDRLSGEIQTIAHAKTTPSGHLRIGAPVEFGKMYLPGIIAGYRRHFPAVTFTLVLENAATLVPRVDAGGLDFAYVDMFPIRGQMAGLPGYYSVEPLIEEEVILAASGRYYRQSVGRPHTAARLEACDWIAYRSDAVAPRNWFKHHFNRSSAHLKVVLEVDSHQAVIGAIREDVGLGVVASHMVREDIQRGDIVPITTRRRNVINCISLIQLADKIPTLAEKTFQSQFVDRIRRAGLSTPYFRAVGSSSS